MGFLSKLFGGSDSISEALQNSIETQIKQVKIPFTEQMC
ncbi:hypothetical protein THIOSC13_1260007 [uncultured Thiomicrorhabdus sp.]